MRHAYLLAVLVPAAMIAACSSGGTMFPGTGGGTTQTTSSGTGNASSTTGPTGSGGSTTSSSGTMTSSSGTMTTSSSTSSSTSTTSSTSSTSSSGMPSGACTDAADQTKLAALGNALETDVQNCAQQSFGAEPQTTTCIKNATMLSDACVACFDANVHCAIMNCALQCAGGMSAGCTSCLHTNCTPAFNTCSGLMGP